MEETNSITIKEWAADDRPREKLLQQGRHSLSEAELVAILIRSGSRHETAVELSRRILSSSGNNLNELAKLNVTDLKKFRGVGEAKALSIVAALELGRRRNQTGERVAESIMTAREAFVFMAPHLLDLPHEEFHVLLLNRAKKLIRHSVISKGGVGATLVDPKIVFKMALDHLASFIILCHNHPSGNLRPSVEDISLTRKLMEAGKLLEIPVFDHIIITNTAYFSFADEGLVLPKTMPVLNYK